MIDLVALAALVAALLADERKRARTGRGGPRPAPQHRAPWQLAYVAEEVTDGFLAWFRANRPKGLLGRDFLMQVVTDPIWKEEMERASGGVRYLGHGSFRVVFDLGQAVLKVDFFPGEREDNFLEAELWDWALEHPETGLHEVIAPVLAVAQDGRWLLMERVRPCPLSKTRALLEDIGDRLDALRPHGVHIEDVSLNNMGLSVEDNRLKVLDYAWYSLPGMP